MFGFHGKILSNTILYYNFLLSEKIQNFNVSPNSIVLQIDSVHKRTRSAIYFRLVNYTHSCLFFLYSLHGFVLRWYRAILI